MSFQCSNCFRTFAKSHGLKYHQQNKVCIDKQIHCAACGGSFTRQSSLKRHLDNGHCPHYQPPVSLVRQPTSISQPSLSPPIAPLSPLLRSVSTSQLPHPPEPFQPNVVLKLKPKSIRQNLIQEGSGKFPVAYGMEDLERIYQVDGDIICPLVERHVFKCIPNLFQKIHANQQFPEYHNVYIPREKAMYAMVSDGHHFTHQSKKTIVDQIIEDKRSIINQYIDDHEDELDKRVLEKYERYQNQIDSDPQFRKELEIEIGGLLLDMKEIIINTQ